MAASAERMGICGAHKKLATRSQIRDAMTTFDTTSEYGRSHRGHPMARNNLYKRLSRIDWLVLSRVLIEAKRTNKASKFEPSRETRLGENHFVIARYHQKQEGTYIVMSPPEWIAASMHTRSTLKD